MTHRHRYLISLLTTTFLAIVKISIRTEVGSFIFLLEYWVWISWMEMKVNFIHGLIDTHSNLLECIHSPDDMTRVEQHASGDAPRMLSSC